MAKLTKIQLTTFIDIISQDNYRAPLYYSSIEQGIERKGLISLHKDRSVRLTKAGEQLANEINKRRETQDLAHMSIDEVFSPQTRYFNAGLGRIEFCVW